MSRCGRVGFAPSPDRDRRSCDLATLAGSVTGTAMYRERIALPPDAVFEARLQDVSRADAPALLISRAVLDPAGQPPFRFDGEDAIDVNLEDYH